MKQRPITHTTGHASRAARLASALSFAMLIGLHAASASAQEMPKFDIFEYKIEGNSLLADLQVERAVMPFLGEGKTLLEVEAARAGLERAYHDAGFLTVVVSIPEQNVDSGIVELQVAEAPVDRLRIKGSEYHSLSRIKSRVPELAEGKVPHFPTMQDQLAGINRSADIKTTPILRAGKAPNTVEVQLEVEDQLPVHGSVELSNRQSPNTSPSRLMASLRYDNLWQRGHSIGLTAQTSPQKTDEVRVLAGSYVMPVGGSGDALSLYAVHSRSALATLANAPGLGMLGNTDIAGLRYTFSLGSIDNFWHTLAVGADYKKVKQSVVVKGAGDLATPITYAPLVAAYTSNWMGADKPTVFDLTATIGMRGLLGNDDREFAAKRAGASASFVALRGGLQHTEAIGRWALAGKLEFQLASGPLVSNEQYAAGGAESVRGYYEGESAGDHALRASLELRTPQYKPAGVTSHWGVTGLAFFDAVQLRLLHPVFPQPDRQLLRGVGVGFRLAAPRGMSFELDWARALNNADITREGDNRLHARLMWEY